MTYIRSTLESIINISMSDITWDQASLPVSRGGFGIRKATQVALSAFLSSVTASQPLVAQLLPLNLLDRAGTNDPTFVAAVLVWEARTGSESVQLPFATEQKCWDEP
jgi:hypothetical protein